MKNFQGVKFSANEFNQGDFGKIYFNLPSETHFPKSTDDLARTLKRLNRLGKQVTIRNTGHSVNGQTLTSGVQVNVGEIKKIHFNSSKLEITVGAGNTWHDVMTAIKFPKYCTPIFPNNPGQQIKVGGTASVGGVGFYSSKYGGFWNHVKKLKLVTMTGEVLECSPKLNPDYFKYALGGFGRIGVISELTLSVVPSKRDVLGIVLFYSNEKKYFESIKKIAQDPAIDGFTTSEQINDYNVYSKVLKFFRYVTLFLDVTPHENINKKFEYIKKTYHQDFSLFLTDSKNNQPDVSFTKVRCAKKDVVYLYPDDHVHSQLEFAHPWSDYVIPPKHYMKFMNEARKILDKYKIGQYITRQSILQDQTAIDTFGAYSCKKMSPDGSFPLSFDLPGEEYSMLVSIMPSVPMSEIKKSLKMVSDLTDLCYSLKGKRYLYGIHNLSKKQVQMQFGKQVIEKWQQIKDELDPKHLLNIGAIEHLDN